MSTKRCSCGTGTTEAASALTDISSLEAVLTTNSPDRDGVSRLRVDRDAFEVTSEGTYADGHTEASTMTVIDGIRYETIEGRTTRTPVSPGEGLEPFGPSSQAVIAAAMTGATVTEAGSQSIGSVESTRYDIDPSEQSTAALNALTPNELVWFELEYPDQVESVSIWIGDDIIRQIELTQNGVTTRVSYTNFNGDITVAAPSGPFVDNFGS